MNRGHTFSCQVLICPTLCLSVKKSTNNKLSNHNLYKIKNQHHDLTSISLVYNQEIREKFPNNKKGGSWPSFDLTFVRAKSAHNNETPKTNQKQTPSLPKKNANFPPKTPSQTSRIEPHLSFLAFCTRKLPPSCRDWKNFQIDPLHR